LINPITESLISLKEAAKLFPERRGGRKPHLSCMYRYTVSGCRGIVLDSVQAGSTRATSREAVARFFRALSTASPTRAKSDSAESQTRREIEIKAANEQLDRVGI
jgi:Protein of unknown function (DUF1580)